MVSSIGLYHFSVGLPTVLEVHLNSRPIRRLAHPNVEIFPLPRLEEHDIITVVELGQFVELVQLCLRVELRILATVG